MSATKLYYAGVCRRLLGVLIMLLHGLLLDSASRPTRRLVFSGGARGQPDRGSSYRSPTGGL